MTDNIEVLYDKRIKEGKLTSDPAQRAVVHKLERLRSSLSQKDSVSLLGRFFQPKAEEGPLGLYLWGGVGRGKSMLMDLFYDSLTVPSRRVHFHAFMQEIHSEMAAARQRKVQDALAVVATEIASTVRVLCFDEMQITDITDAMIVGRLFEALFAAGIKIVTTSNRPPSDLYKDGLNRQLFLPFIALMEERLEVVELTSLKDYRQDRLKDTKTYFHPLSFDTRTQIQEIWRDLSNGQSEHLTLKVHGRTVEISAFSNGVAKASFSELCDRPLGAADYLALAQQIRVLVLTDVPQLSHERFNAAKRFVTLIDVIYEAKLCVIISAETVPQMLYIEGDGAFEFERTVSRLLEMQSTEWLNNFNAIKI